MGIRAFRSSWLPPQPPALRRRRRFVEDSRHGRTLDVYVHVCCHISQLKPETIEPPSSATAGAPQSEMKRVWHAWAKRSCIVTRPRLDNRLDLTPHSPRHSISISRFVEFPAEVDRS
eukprot:GHVR01081111.1.p1 GENE.GHVR01081111.1~~GHVR01081111.1.p1  ORF type:complete len:117 (+),score=7.52 GHVR01081111.1:259-609(+)